MWKRNIDAHKCVRGAKGDEIAPPDKYLKKIVNKNAMKVPIGAPQKMPYQNAS
jgi:hypothetical protein